MRVFNYSKRLIKAGMWYPVAVNNEFSGSKTPATRISHGRALDLRIRFMDLIAVIFELSEEREREKEK